MSQRKIYLISVFGVLIAVAFLIGTLLSAPSNESDLVEVSAPVMEVSESHRDISSVQAVHGGTNPIIPGGRAMGIRDIVDILALIIVAALILVAWVVSTIRNRNDPVKQWEKKL